MIFSELYGRYYNIVAGCIKKIVENPQKKYQFRELVGNETSIESVLNIESAVKDEKWQIIKPDGSTPLTHVPTMPLTKLQKRWIKAIYADPRIKLFTDKKMDFPDVEPLFSMNDVEVFDKYCDGDPYEDKNYIRNFRMILDAINNKYALSIEMKNNRGNIVRLNMIPEYLEYSEKDDKFRVIGSSRKRGDIVNVARIISCKRSDNNSSMVSKTKAGTETVEFELVDKRNALERALMHFAHFEKQVERIGDDKYRVSLSYDKDDETELVIRILMFGPMIKVIGPQSFVYLIEERLIKQMDCDL